MAGIGLLEIVGGAFAILGIFAAFMIWAVFPLLPFLLMGGIYALVRYGLPAAGRAAVAVEHRSLAGVRWLLYPVAVWTLRAPQPAAVRRGDGRGRR